jgi:hypothetical protein
MYWLSPQQLLSVLCIVLLGHGVAALEITFPRAGTNYSSSPYHIEWQPPGAYVTCPLVIEITPFALLI